jgi:hypothetical protein
MHMYTYNLFVRISNKNTGDAAPHKHTYINTYMLTYIHSFILTYIRTYVHTYIHTYIHTGVLTYIHIYIHTYIQTGLVVGHGIYACTHMHTLINMHTLMNMHTLTHKATHVPLSCTCTLLSSSKHVYAYVFVDMHTLHVCNIDIHAHRRACLDSHAWVPTRNMSLCRRTCPRVRNIATSCGKPHVLGKHASTYIMMMVIMSLIESFCYRCLLRLT